MAVYFLQQLKPPVLPVLHQIIDFETIQQQQQQNSAIPTPTLSKKSKTRSSFKNRNLDDEEDDDLFEQSESAANTNSNNDDETINKLNFNIFKTNLSNFVSFNRLSRDF